MRGNGDKGKEEEEEQEQEEEEGEGGCDPDLANLVPSGALVCHLESGPFQKKERKRILASRERERKKEETGERERGRREDEGRTKKDEGEKKEKKEFDPLSPSNRLSMERGLESLSLAERFPVGEDVQTELEGFGLRVVHSEVKGRHIVAERDFEEGDLVGCFFPLQSAILDNYKKR